MKIKSMSDGITEFNRIGICKVDTDKICQAFRESSVICEFGGEFKLLDYTPVRFLKRLKIEISRQDAEVIIAQLGLIKLKDPVFARASKYKLLEKSDTSP
jgi:hypothetical protein